MGSRWRKPSVAVSIFQQQSTRNSVSTPQNILTQSPESRARQLDFRHYAVAWQPATVASRGVKMDQPWSVFFSILYTWCCASRKVSSQPYPPPHLSTFFYHFIWWKKRRIHFVGLWRARSSQSNFNTPRSTSSAAHNRTEIQLLFAWSETLTCISDSVMVVKAKYFKQRSFFLNRFSS